jgi:hypothetical protein
MQYVRIIEIFHIGLKSALLALSKIFTDCKRAAVSGPAARPDFN